MLSKRLSPQETSNEGRVGHFHSVDNDEIYRFFPGSTKRSTQSTPVEVDDTAPIPLIVGIALALFIGFIIIICCICRRRAISNSPSNQSSAAAYQRAPTVDGVPSGGGFGGIGGVGVGGSFPMKPVNITYTQSQVQGTGGLPGQPLKAGNMNIGQHQPLHPYPSLPPNAYTPPYPLGYGPLPSYMPNAQSSSSSGPSIEHGPGGFSPPPPAPPPTGMMSGVDSQTGFRSGTGSSASSSGGPAGSAMSQGTGIRAGAGSSLGSSYGPGTQGPGMEIPGSGMRGNYGLVQMCNFGPPDSTGPGSRGNFPTGQVYSFGPPGSAVSGGIKPSFGPSSRLGAQGSGVGVTSSKGTNFGPSGLGMISTGESETIESGQYTHQQPVSQDYTVQRIRSPLPMIANDTELEQC